MYKKAKKLMFQFMAGYRLSSIKSSLGLSMYMCVRTYYVT